MTVKILDIVCMSDTHNRHTQLTVPPGDVLVHAGDATIDGTREEFRDFMVWFKSHPHKYKIFVPGNHDSVWQGNEYYIAQSLSDGVTVLIDNMVEIEGFVFYGSPWTPRFGSYSFMYKRKSAEARRIRDKIPEFTDVLITHGPPRGVGDIVWKDHDDTSMALGDFGSKKRYHRIHVGCKALWERIQIVKPQIHIFGHIHVGRGVYEGGSKFYRLEGTTFVNAANCQIRGATYVLDNEPVVVHAVREE